VSSRAAIDLTREETSLLLTCRPYLDGGEEEQLAMLARSSLDWEYVLWRAETLRTLSLAWHHLTRLGLEQAPPEGVAHYFDLWSGISRLRTQLLLDELLLLTDALDGAGVDYFLFKGSALVGTAYPDPLARPMLDVDLMVLPQDALRTRDLLVEHGFLHAYWDSDTNAVTPLAPHQLVEYHSAHYELPILMKLVEGAVDVPSHLIPHLWRRKHLKFFLADDGIASFPLFVDVHVNLSLDFDLADVWGGVRRERMLEHDVAVQSPAGMVWFLAARIYHEAFQLNICKLSMWGDLQAVLRRWGDEVDWDEVVRVAEKYGMQPALFYVLSHLGDVVGAEAPQPVLDRLRPDRLPVPAAHDWGDILPKLLGRAVVYDVRPEGTSAPSEASAIAASAGALSP
jgi:hypothetical protein